MTTPAVGPGVSLPTVVDRIEDHATGLYRVHVVPPDGKGRWIVIPKGLATLEFVQVAAAAFNVLLTAGQVGP